MKLNRKNADINNILDKKVAIICDSKEKELDFRKWAKQYNDNIRDDCCYICTDRYGKCINLVDDGINRKSIYYYKNNNYNIYEWEIAEEEKIYTIKDVVENEGKIYRTTTYDCIYKYDKTYIYYKFTWKLSEPWKKTGLTLGEIIKLKFIEYKPELKKITFGDALKEMEQGKVCRSTFSNRRITIVGSQFIDASNGENTKLTLPEIKGEWVVIEE